MRRVSAHFDVHQFRQLRHEGGRPVPYPPEWVISRLVPLAYVLDDLQQEVGVQLVVLRGYISVPECERLDEWSEERYHSEGHAADVAGLGVGPEEVVKALLRLRRRGRRVGGIGLYPQFVHLDQRAGPPHFFQVQHTARSAGPLPRLNLRETLCLGCENAVSRCTCPKEVD